MNNVILLGDFNLSMEDFPMKIFYEIFLRITTSYQRAKMFQKPRECCIDLLLINKSLSFKNKNVIETWLSDFHKLVVGVMNMHFPKMKTQVIRYRKYKDFQNETTSDSLRHELNIQGRFLNEKGLDTFSTIFTEVLGKHASKKLYIQSNHKPFINNEISKAILMRTRLRNRIFTTQK